MSALVRVGLVPRSYLLTTQGRKTGRPRTNPVVPVEHDGRHWLVAPYGPVSWVHNARAAGRVSLARRGHTRDYAIREVISPDEAGPVLQRYVRLAPPRNHTSRRARTPLWRTSSLRRAAIRCSSSCRRARITNCAPVNANPARSSSGIAMSRERGHGILSWA